MRFAFVAVSLFVLVAFSGCGQKPDETPKTDTQQLEASFSTADAGAKSLVEKAVKFIQAADYGSASDSLRNLLQLNNLTPEQTLVASNLFREASKHPRSAP